MSNWWENATAAGLGGALSGAPGGSGSDNEALVTQVKELCKSSPIIEEQWLDFTKKKGGGTKDPKRHAPEFLLEFISTANSAASMGLSAPTKPGLHPGTDESLVAQIKEMQRYDQNARDQWAAFAHLKGRGVLDPNRHGAEFLQEFLVGMNSGSSFTQQQAAMPGGFGEIIKSMQKKSPEFRGLWAQYCAAQGGKCDPMKHDDASHLAFFEAMSVMALGGAVGSSAPDVSAGDVAGSMNDLAAIAAMGGLGGMGTMGGMGGMMGIQGPPDNPAKKARTDEGPSGGGGDMKEQLVNQVKAFQKSGPEQKELWSVYAQAYLGGVLDPNRHEAHVLLEFCINHNVPEAPSSGGGNFGGLGISLGAGAGTGLGMFGAPVPSPAAAGLSADPEMGMLVEKVKAFQKSSQDNWQIWCSFCGLTKDPARHDTGKLREFCVMYGL